VLQPLEEWKQEGERLPGTGGCLDDNVVAVEEGRDSPYLDWYRDVNIARGERGDSMRTDAELAKRVQFWCS
jgi:hypothetical protein